jgi:membrane peptidoglycan carboxypeptidase
MNQSNMMMNMLMANLQRQNPQAYSQIQQWMNSGQNPQQILQNMLQSGQITQAQIDQAQGIANQFKNQKRF